MKVVFIGPYTEGGSGVSPRYFRPNGKLLIGETYTVTSTVMFSFKEGFMPAYFLAEKCRIRRDISSPEYGMSIPYGARHFVPLEYYKAEFSVSNHEEQEDRKPN